MVLQKLHAYIQKKEIRPVSITLHQMDQTLKCEIRNNETVRDTILNTLHNIGVYKDFQNSILFAKKFRPTIDK